MSDEKTAPVEPSRITLVFEDKYGGFAIYIDGDLHADYSEDFRNELLPLLGIRTIEASFDCDEGFPGTVADVEAANAFWATKDFSFTDRHGTDIWTDRDTGKLYTYNQEEYHGDDY